jgi:uncharacterized membrane protein YfcA
VSPAFLGLSVAEWAAAAIIVLTAGVVRGFAGFGAGLVMVPSLTLIIGPVAAVPLVVLLEAVASLQLVPPAIPLVRWRTILPLGLAAMLMIPIGGGVLAALDPALMQRMISSLVLIFVIVLWTGWRYRSEPTTLVTSATGAASGLLTGLAGVGGPPVILFFFSGPHPAPTVRASLLCYFGMTQLVALITFIVYGLLNAELLIRAAILAPLFMGAAHIGAKLFGHVDERLFRRLMLIFLAIMSVVGLLWVKP